MGDSRFFIHDQDEQNRVIEAKRKLVLEFLSTETFSTSAILGKLLKLSRSGTYSTLKKMEKEGLIKLYEIEYEIAQRGKQTIWGITQTGALLATDLEDFHIEYFEAGRIAVSTLSHSIGVQHVKIAGMEKGWNQWESSRKLKQKAAKDRKKWKQIPDALAVKDGKVVAFEIEKTAKSSSRYETILANYAEMFLDGTVAGVIYICPENLMKRLEMLFSKIEKITIQGRMHPVHENVRKRIKFMTLQEWRDEK
ncbi:MAG: replication-relaxation family protein [Lactococcus lactis]|jgi:DNA-binding Lrp family transcriptional regulator|nr:replication-relaxation family protein [Chryseobacterium sp.]MDN5487736.1 replication-relaxation family protein [Lactococcus lactis]